MLGNRLKDLRSELNLTQDDIAKKLKIPRGTYAHYELNKRQPDNDTLNRLADFFNVSIDYLFGRTESRSIKVEILEFDATEGLTESDLNLVRNLIENLKEKNKANK